MVKIITLENKVSKQRSSFDSDDDEEPMIKEQIVKVSKSVEEKKTGSDCSEIKTKAKRSKSVGDENDSISKTKTMSKKTNDIADEEYNSISKSKTETKKITNDLVVEKKVSETKTKTNELVVKDREGEEKIGETKTKKVKDVNDIAKAKELVAKDEVQ